MRLLVTARFRRAYAALPADDQKLVQKALCAMAEDLRHPGLHVKRIQGTQRIWEARASRSVRMTFETEGDAVILRTVGRHDEALGNP
jgi:mRNA-degrading endonuclease RelE of RelBE toxin-antitoxin system